MKYLLSFILLLSFTSCSRYHCDYNVVGPDEFVIDSYQIRQGKVAILAMTGECLEEMPFDAYHEYEDLIAENDILNIAVYHPSRKDLVEIIEKTNKSMGGFRVTNGEVNFPEVESVKVVGFTLEEARQEVQKKFRENFTDAEVFISYKDRLSSRVELSGKVGLTSIPVNGTTRLYEVLANAKISSGANLFMSYLLRDGNQLPVDFHRLIVQGDMSQNIVMQPGDKIYIADGTEGKVLLMGEVGIPTAVSVPYGYITLPEALVAARGIPYTGDRRHIQVIRGDLQNPKIYTISWEHIIHLPNDSMLLIPGDTVYVSEKPITQWNRFISQLMPSLQGLQVGNATYAIIR